MRLLTLALLASSAALAATTGVLAQQPAAALQPATTPATPDSGSVTLKLKTTLTIEDVTVTDAKDQPVHGLTKGDFTVKEDGKPQTIKNFEEHDASSARPAPPSLPPGTYTNRGAAAPTSVNIFLFDNLTNGSSPYYAPENLMRARQQAAKYLKTLPEGAEVAILTMSNGVRVVQGFTMDRDALLAAIDSVKPEPASGAYLTQPPPDAPPPPPDEICAVMNAQSEITTSALAGIAGFVSEIKGRKNLLWFTPGIPWLTHYFVYSRNPCLWDRSLQLENAYGLLRTARVAVYPIDPKGLGMRVRFDDHVSVQDFAKNTGGRAFYDRNDLDAAIAEAIANGTDYYSLSYVPPLAKYDGKYHTISVKADWPGLNLIYREGYTAMDAQQPKPKPDKKNSGKAAAQMLNAGAQPVNQFHDAMNHGPDGDDLTFYVHLQPSAAASISGGSPMKESINPKLNGQPLIRYDFEYVVPAGEITLSGSDGSGAQTASAQLAVAVFSPQGELLNAAGRTVAFPIKSGQTAQFTQRASRVTVQVDLPPGKVLVRAGVLDVASQKWGTLEIPDAGAAR